MSEPLLLAERLSVSLEGNRILKDVSFAVQPGEWIGVLGPNGSGKTTLLRAISGVLPYEGTLCLENRAIDAWKPRALARRMAFVRQQVSLAFDFAIEDLVLLGRSPHKDWLDPYSATDRSLVAQALARLDLEGLAHRPVYALSGGEQQRVFLAQALVQQSDILLLDEPTAHLDIHHQFELLAYVQHLVREGRTVMTAFHDLELAARFVDRIFVMDHGQIVQSGRPAEVLTEEVIREVFRMDATVRQLDESLHISYHRPVEY